MQKNIRLFLDLKFSKYCCSNFSNVLKINGILDHEAESFQFFANLKKIEIH